MEECFEELNNKDYVISLNHFQQDRVVLEHPMFTVGQFLHQTEIYAIRGIADGRKGRWFLEGVSCELLKLNANKWQKGRVRLKISLEFCPDEPEETSLKCSLDEIRQMMDDRAHNP